MPNFELHTLKARKTQHVLISAHGAWHSGGGDDGGFCEVPRGLDLHFYSPHGTALKVGGAWTFLMPPGVPIFRSISGPALVHDYSLTTFPEKVEIDVCLKRAADAAAQPLGAAPQFLSQHRPENETWALAAVPSSATMGPMDVLTIDPRGAKLSEAVEFLQKRGYNSIHCSFCRVDLATQTLPTHLQQFPSYSPATQNQVRRIDVVKWSDVK